MSKNPMTNVSASDDEDEGGLDMIGQIRSSDPVYRKISSAANQELGGVQSSKFGQEILSLTFSPDGTIFAYAVGTGTVCIHSLAELIPTLSKSAGKQTGVSARAQISRWAQETQADQMSNPRWQDVQGSKLAELDTGGHSITFLAFGQRAASIRRESDVKYSRAVKQFSGDLVLAVGLASGQIKIWDMNNGKLTLFLQDHSDAITDLQFAPDGSFVLVSSAKDKSVKLWDLLDDGNMFKCFDMDYVIKQVAWSPDAKRMATVGNGKDVMVWELEGYTLEKKLQGHQHAVTGCRFSADGKLLYTSSFDTRVICWDVQTGKIVRKFEHMSPPPSAIFASGSNEHEVQHLDLVRTRLVTICNDGNMRIWNVDSKDEKPVSLVGIMPEAISIRVSPDEKVVAVGCKGGFVQFYSLE